MSRQATTAKQLVRVQIDAAWAAIERARQEAQGVGQLDEVYDQLLTVRDALDEITLMLRRVRR